ncbi:MAG: hypothetical protein ACTSQY_03080 [Candidatus Odinarchaeia archaeon]
MNEQNQSEYIQKWKKSLSEIKCPICSKSFPQNALINHLVTDHPEVIGKGNYTICPFCGVELRRDNLKKHISKVHVNKKSTQKTGKLRKKGNGPIMICPYRQARMPRSRLRAHVDSKHPYRKTQDEVKKDNNVSPTDLAERVIIFLKNRNFLTQKVGKFIIAKNGSLGKTICVRIADKNDYRELNNTSIFHTFRRFQRIISQFHRKITSFVDPSKFDTAVITPFGWHADRSEIVRHDALVDASQVWGISHIANVLFWMRNAWPNNPTVDKYSDIVISDYNWYSNNVGNRTGNRNTLYLRGVLSKELSKHWNKIKLVQSVNEIDQWFVIAK